MEKKWKALRTGFYAAAAVELLRLEGSFSPGINRRNSITCHFELLCLIFAQQPFVRAILNLSDNPEFPPSSDGRHKVVPGIIEWADSLGYSEEIKSIVDLIFKNELHVDSGWMKPFRRSFQNNPQFTLYLFQNAGEELLNARSSIPLAKLKLRMLYLVSVYQCSSIYEFKRQRLSKEINSQERLLRSEDSQMRSKQRALTPHQKERIEEIKDNLTKLEGEYSTFADLANWSEKPPHGQKRRSWVKRLQYYVERRSQEIKGELTEREKRALFPSEGAAESIICSEKIYQILDDLEDEDLQVERLEIII